MGDSSTLPGADMKELSDSTRYRLLREARKDPSALLTRQKFWKPAFWPHYHRLCSDTLFDDPVAGLLAEVPCWPRSLALQPQPRRRSACYRLERPVAGWESHPLRTADFHGALFSVT